MSKEFNTLELARVYESQGHYESAYEIYNSLDGPGAGSEIKSGLKRMEDRMGGAPIKNNSSTDTQLANQLKEWLNLLVLQQRLEKFKKIQSRLT